MKRPCAWMLVIVSQLLKGCCPLPNSKRRCLLASRSRSGWVTWPAQICLQYGSRGAKQFVDEMVPALKSEFPHVDVVVEKRSGHSPFLEGFYRNGRRKPVGVKVRGRRVCNTYTPRGPSWPVAPACSFWTPLMICWFWALSQCCSAVHHWIPGVFLSVTSICAGRGSGRN